MNLIISRKCSTNQGLKSNEQCIMEMQFQSNAQLLSESESEQKYWILDREGKVHLKRVL